MLLSSMKQTYDEFIKCTNKIKLLMAGEHMHMVQKVISKSCQCPSELKT